MNTKVLLLAGTFMATASLAHAADITYAPAPYVAPVQDYDWNGFYLGLHGGWGWSQGTASYVDDLANDFCGVNSPFWGCALPLDPSGAFVGGQAGYNFVFGSGLMIGIEGDYSFARLIDSGEGAWASPSSPTHVDLEVDQMATIQGRLGWAMGRFLPFATVGYGWAHAERSAYNPVTLPGGSSIDDAWHSGLTLGAGAEYGINDNWSVKGEYRYFNGSEEIYGLAFGSGTNVDLDIHTVRFGVNYRF